MLSHYKNSTDIFNKKLVADNRDRIPQRYPIPKAFATFTKLLKFSKRNAVLTTLLILFTISFQTLIAQDLYDIYSVKDVKITFADDNWAFLLDSLKDDGNDHRILADVSLNGVVYKDVGVRYKGNSSFYNTRKSESTKLPFNIKANYTKKKQRFKGGYKTLKLSNVFRDPSF
ncbi:MAG: hypothetical protein AB8G22_00645, partial [Saprospiraceae bacterium]